MQFELINEKLRPFTNFHSISLIFFSHGLQTIIWSLNLILQGFQKTSQLGLDAKILTLMHPGLFKFKA